MNQLPVSTQSLEPIDSDPGESAEWRDALLSLLETSGSERTRQILDMLDVLARDPKIAWTPTRGTPYVNSIPVDHQPAFPGDLAMEERIASLVRWNALAMVVRANKAYGELGGHIASYASAADLFETGFNHFFQARSDDAVASVGVTISCDNAGTNLLIRAQIHDRLRPAPERHFFTRLHAPSHPVHALVADAPGRPLPARVLRHTRQGRQLHGPGHQHRLRH